MNKDKTIFGARHRLTLENMRLRKVADAAVAVQIAKGALARAAKVEGFSTRAVNMLISAEVAADNELQKAVRAYREYLEYSAPLSPQKQAALDRGLDKLVDLENGVAMELDAEH